MERAMMLTPEDIDNIRNAVEKERQRLVDLAMSSARGKP
jgi:hypothetical protein